MSKFQYEPLTCEKEFENLINDLCNEEYSDYTFHKYGSSGQKQHGIDGKSTCGKIVYQCKNKDTRFMKDSVKIRNKLIEELKKDTLSANNYFIKEKQQSIEKFIFAHTVKKDTHIQDEATELIKNCSFNIIIWSWDEISDLLEKYPTVYEKYYENKKIKAPSKPINKEENRNKRVPKIIKPLDAWKQLHNYKNLTDDERNILISKVENNFNTKQYKDILIVRHIYSVFIFLQSNGLYKNTKENILFMTKENIDYLFIEGKIKLSDFQPPSVFDNNHKYDNLNYLEIQDHDKKIFYNYIELKFNEINPKILKKVAVRLIANLDNRDVLIDILLKYQDADGIFYKKPILCFINIKNFIIKFNSFTKDEIESFGEILSYRYEKDEILKDLKCEISFLKSISIKLLEKKQTLNSKIDVHILNEFIQKRLQKAINDLQKYIDNTKEENKQ